MSGTINHVLTDNQLGVTGLGVTGLGVTEQMLRSQADNRLAGSQSCTALDRISVNEAALKFRYPEKNRYHLYRSSRAPSLICCWRPLSGLRRVGWHFLQRIILITVILTTVVTWSGVLHPKVSNGVELSPLKEDVRHCIVPNNSIEWGHTNPCWNFALPIGCKSGCSKNLVCAPKVIIVGVNGCYNKDIISPLSSPNGLLVAHKEMYFNGSCPIEYLATVFKQFQKDFDKTAQPVFINVDENLLTSYVQRSRSQSLDGGELGRLSDWLRPTSRIVVSVCDPIQRFLRYINKTLVIIEPTKKAVHSYIQSRLDRAQKCIDLHGPEECQYMDSREDDVYSHLLQGIYSPYIAKLQKYIPQKLLRVIHFDWNNATAYTTEIKNLSQALSISWNFKMLQATENNILAKSKDSQTLLNSLSLQTVSAISRFYARYKH